MADDDDILMVSPDQQIEYLKQRFDGHRNKVGSSQKVNSNYGKIMSTLQGGGCASDKIESSGSGDDKKVVENQISTTTTTTSGKKKKRKKRDKAPPATRAEMMQTADAVRRDWERLGSAPPTDRQKLFGDNIGSTISNLKQEVALLKEQLAGSVATPEVRNLRKEVDTLRQRLTNQQAVIKGLKDRLDADVSSVFVLQDYRASCGYAIPKSPVQPAVHISIAYVSLSTPDQVTVCSNELQTISIRLQVNAEEYGGCQVSRFAWAFPEATLSKIPEKAFWWALQSTVNLQQIPTAIKPTIGIQQGNPIRESCPLTGSDLFYGEPCSQAVKFATTGETNEIITGCPADLTIRELDDIKRRIGLIHLECRFDSKMVDSCYRIMLLSENDKKSNCLIRKRVSLEDPVGMPTTWTPPEINNSTSWPPNGNVTIVTVMIERYQSIVVWDKVEAHAALKKVKNEVRRLLKETVGYESRIGPDYVMTIVYHDPTAAIEFSLKLQQTIAYCEWSSALLSFPAAACITLGGTVILRGPRLSIGIHSTMKGSQLAIRVDAFTKRQHYHSPDCQLSVAAAAAAIGGEIVATEATVKMFESRGLLSGVKFAPCRTISLSSTDPEHHCFIVYNSSLQHRLAFIGRGVGRDTGSTEKSSKLQRLLDITNTKCSDLQNQIQTQQTSLNEANCLISKMTEPMKPIPRKSFSNPDRRPMLDAKLYRSFIESNYSLKAIPIPRWSTIVICDVPSQDDLLRKCGNNYLSALSITHDCIISNLFSHMGYVSSSRKGTYVVLFNEVERAVKWAVKVQEDLLNITTWPDEIDKHEASQKDDEGQLRGLRVAIGIHTAFDSVVGEIDPTTSKTVLVGPVVNIASLIQRKSIGGEILVSKEVVDRIPLNLYHIDDFGYVDVKGPVQRSTSLFNSLSSNKNGFHPISVSRITSKEHSRRRIHLQRPPSNTTTPTSLQKISSDAVICCARIFNRNCLRDQLRDNPDSVHLHRLFNNYAKLAEDLASQYNGYAAQRLPDLHAISDGAASAVYIFPGSVQAVQWSLHMQIESMGLELAPSLESAEDLSPISSSDENSEYLFRGIRLCIGLYPSPAVAQHHDLTPFSSGLVSNLSGKYTSMLLCAAAAPGEVLIPHRVLTDSTVTELIKRETVCTQITDIAYGDSFEDVYRLLPIRLKSREKYICEMLSSCVVPQLQFSVSEMSRQQSVDEIILCSTLERHRLRMISQSCEIIKPVEVNKSLWSSYRNAYNSHCMWEKRLCLTETAAMISEDYYLQKMCGVSGGVVTAERYLGYLQSEESHVKNSDSSTSYSANSKQNDTESHHSDPTEAAPVLSPLHRKASHAGNMRKHSSRKIIRRTEGSFSVEQKYNQRLADLESELLKYKQSSTELKKIHSAIRVFVTLCITYCDPLIEEGRVGLSEDEFCTAWLKSFDPSDKSRSRKRCRDEVAELARLALGDGKEIVFSQNCKKLGKSVLGHCAQLFVLLKTILMSTRKRHSVRRISVARSDLAASDDNQGKRRSSAAFDFASGRLPALKKP